MKTISLMLLVTLFCVTAYSQEYTYCKLVGIGKLFSNKVTVSIDFGQETKFFQDNRYKDDLGKPVVFNGMIDALNFMGLQGWEFVQAYTIGDSKMGYVYHWLLKKKNE